MLKKLRNSFLSLLLVITMAGCVDQSGGSASNDELTIAATSVAVCEVLEALDVPASQVIAIPTTESYTVPERYQDAIELGTAMAPDMEQLATLKPDLILSPNSLEGELASKYSDIKISSAFLNLKSISGMFKSIEELGKLLDCQDEATKLVDEYVDYMVSFREKYQNQTSPRVLILMGLPGGSYVVATESSYVGDLVRLAGGTNIYGDGDGQDFVNVNVEDMLQQNPDIILRTSHAMPEQVMESFKTEFAENPIWSQFTAVANNRVYDLDNNYFGMSANFNYQKGLENLEEILYGTN
ncbi:heme ABC transporter substrate-binding protein IsdE [uncultured Thomasclavelia sp.]|uniref:heme ABC transporter substrate-binding protein IsdE n=1 Tax=uncultured Thomasclavelia sp. TaxID=3025759 RepID=UPI0025DEFC16|nr:heme ABC transporter substrate-binding protein IsdE [uncultured Thomasclavelia sp.]